MGKTEKRGFVSRTEDELAGSGPGFLPGPHFRVHAVGDTFIFSHPVSGTEYILTVRGLEQQTIAPEHLPQNQWRYPTHFSILQYTISPDPGREIAIFDCAEADAAVRTGPASDGIIGAATGPTAVILEGGPEKNLHAACSSLHFEPAEGDIEWRVEFRKK